MTDDIAKLVETFEAGIRGKPNYALNLVGLAELVARKKDKARALTLVRRARAMAPDDPRVAARARALLHWMLPGYHVPMMNDARRNVAWDKALRAAIRPGMHVFEIGTGGGMLAMMAARAGAAHVTTCEKDDIAADLARELIARNGYEDRVTVLTADVMTLAPDPRYDLLFCDIFADDLFNFDPLASIAHVRSGLLKPGAPVIPASVELRAALADWAEFPRVAHLENAAGFDLTPMRDFAVATKTLPIGDRNLRLVSDAAVLFHFDLAQDPLPPSASADVACEATADTPANGIARWIRLELNADTVLDSRPQPGVVSFSSPVFCPFAEQRLLRKGERVRVAAHYSGKQLETWPPG